MPAPELPANGRYVLKAARVPACVLEGVEVSGDDLEGVVSVDIAVADGVIAGVAAGIEASEMPAVDLRGRIVWPSPVDLHTHLDKGHIWPRSPNPDGTFMGALDTVRGDREARWKAHDIRARFEFGLRCAYAHGTCAIRTHLDSIPPQAEISFPLFSELRDAWRGRIELQAVSLAMIEHYEGASGERIADIVAEHDGILGLVPLMQPGLDEALDRFFRMAMDRGLDIDMHIDETKDKDARTLRHLAQAAIRNGFDGRMVAGHCCSIAQQEPDEVDRTLDLVAEAGIAVVSLPMCNMYLQDRERGRTPRWRGVTLLHEMKARGIEVCVASDNCRDPFYAYGDHDLHEVFREALRIAHLDHPIGDWPCAVTRTPAAVMGLDGCGVIKAGAPANLVIYEGRTLNETLARPETRRIVLRDGRPIDTALPAYAELDHLMGNMAE